MDLRCKSRHCEENYEVIDEAISYQNPEIATQPMAARNDDIYTHVTAVKSLTYAEIFKDLA